MNANELADVFKSDVFKIGHSITSYHLKLLEEAATMLRQQQAEIEALKREKKSIVRNCIRICQSQNTIITTVTGTTHWGTITDAIDEIRSHYRKRKTQKK